MSDSEIELRGERERLQRGAYKPGESDSESALRRCPCGEIPKDLELQTRTPAKYVHVAGTCCSAWVIEFRADFETDERRLLLDAAAAWNGAPRSQALDLPSGCHKRISVSRYLLPDVLPVGDR